VSAGTKQLIRCGCEEEEKRERMRERKREHAKRS
jgi:hypothetical protein